MRDGAPQLVSAIPLRTGAAVHVFCFLFSSIEVRFFFCSQFRDRGRASFHENELHRNVGT